jgi:DNA-binding NarL/FixJ family response regulator
MATTKPNIQIDDLVREMTDEEYADYQAQQEASATAQAEADAKVAARESALAKLAALGLTPDEIASL